MYEGKGEPRYFLQEKGRLNPEGRVSVQLPIFVIYRLTSSSYHFRKVNA